MARLTTVALETIPERYQHGLPPPRGRPSGARTRSKRSRCAPEPDKSAPLEHRISPVIGDHDLPVADDRSQPAVFCTRPSAKRWSTRPSADDQPAGAGCQDAAPVPAPPPPTPPRNTQGVSKATKGAGGIFVPNGVSDAHCICSVAVVGSSQPIVIRRLHKSRLQWRPDYFGNKRCQAKYPPLLPPSALAISGAK